MSKEEFLEELRQSLSLSGKMSAAEINSNVDYYRAYIEGEIMKGRSEEQVLEELGPARLIAKTLTANIREGNGSERRSSSYENASSQRQQQEQYTDRSDEEAYAEGSSGGKNTVRKVFKGIMIAVIVILCLFLFGYMFRGLFYIAIRFLPAIIFFVVISWILRGGSRGRR